MKKRMLWQAMMETMTKLEYLRLLPHEEVYRQSLPGRASSAGEDGEDFPGDYGEYLLPGEDDGTGHLGGVKSDPQTSRLAPA